MCGLGVIVSGTPIELDRIQRARMDRALMLLRRRGPDGSHTEVSGDGRIVMLHARLAVQDLSDAARQPMISADGRARLVYNGEIYNAAALRDRLVSEGHTLVSRSDTEILFAALLRWGVRATLERVYGMYAFVLVVEDRVIAAVDHAGMKPLAWSFEPGQAGGVLRMASECDALAELRGGRSMDLESVETLLSVGYVPAPSTMDAGVRKLGPGQVLEWRIGDAGGPRVHAHWNPPEEVDPARTLDAQALGAIARQHTIGDRPMAMFLSAGIDSTAIAALIAGSGDLATLTLSPGDATDESAIASDTASRLGMPHERVSVNEAALGDLLRHAGAAFDEPQGYTALFTAMRMTQAAAASDTSGRRRVIIGGDGGDEAFAGYPWHRDPPDHPLCLHAIGAPDARAGALAAAVARPDAQSDERHAAMMALGSMSCVRRYLVRTFGGFHPSEAAALLGRDPEDAFERFGRWLEPADRPALPWPRRAQRLDVLGFCAGSILPKLDRSAGAAGLEIRAPLLDRRVLDTALAAPVDPCELTGEGSKPLLRSIVGSAVKQRRASPEVLHRPKQGFSLRLPGASPLTSLPESIDRSAMLRDGLIRRDWRSFIPDPGTIGGRASGAQRIVALAMLGAWYEHRVG